MMMQKPPPPIPGLEGKPRGSSIATVVFMVGAVLFAGVTGLLLSRLLQTRFPQEPVKTIVVVARDVVSGQKLQAEDLRQAEWPESSIPRGSYTEAEQLLVEEAVPLVPLVAGQAVLTSQLSRPKAGLGVVAKLEPGQRAIAVTCDSGVALAELPYPGAHVDVLSTFRMDGFQMQGRFSRESAETKLLLQNIVVLAVGPEIDAASVAQGQAQAAQQQWFDASGREKRRRVITLAVTPAQAEKLVLATRAGKIDLVLRGPTDDAVVETPGAIPDLIYRSADWIKKASESEQADKVADMQAWIKKARGEKRNKKTRARKARRRRRVSERKHAAAALVYPSGGE